METNPGTDNERAKSAINFGVLVIPRSVALLVRCLAKHPTDVEQ
jgi:hypothetical protein